MAQKEIKKNKKQSPIFHLPLHIVLLAAKKNFQREKQFFQLSTTSAPKKKQNKIPEKSFILYDSAKKKRTL